MENYNTNLLTLINGHTGYSIDDDGEGGKPPPEKAKVATPPVKPKLSSGLSDAELKKAGNNAIKLSNIQESMSASALNKAAKNAINYVDDKTNTTPKLSGSVKSATDRPKDRKIPLPDYKDPASRKKYADKFHKQYGELTSGLGDIPLRVNEKAFWASDTGKNLSVKTAAQYKLDPALLYSSAMVEGMSGLYPDEKNSAKSTGDKEYPVSGMWSFGLDSFDKDKADELIKKGYLPKDFGDQFKMWEGKGGPSGTDYKNENAMFKTTDAGLQAKAAMLKESYDDIEAYAKKKGIPLSNRAKDFFALANFNGGEGVGHQMLTDYNNNGLLKDDAYLKQRPTKGKGLKDTSYKDVYANVKKRIVMADALKEQDLMSDDSSTEGTK